MPPGRALDEAQAIVDDGAREAGRDPATIGMEGRVTLDATAGSTPCWTTSTAGAAPAPPTSRSTRWTPGFATVDDHLAALAKVAEALDLTRAGS